MRYWRRHISRKIDRPEISIHIFPRSTEAHQPATEHISTVLPDKIQHFSTINSNNNNFDFFKEKKYRNRVLWSNKSIGIKLLGGKRTKILRQKMGKLRTL